MVRHLCLLHEETKIHWRNINQENQQLQLFETELSGCFEPIQFNLDSESKRGLKSPDWIFQKTFTNKDSLNNEMCKNEIH